MEKVVKDNLSEQSLIRRNANRFVFLGILTALIVHFLSMPLYKLHAPVFRFPYVDITYWLLHFLHIPDFIVENSAISLSFEIALLLLAFSIILFPTKRYLNIIFFVFYFLFFIISNSYSLHHSHGQVGTLLVASVFLFKEIHFVAMWNAMRYYVAFIFFAAFLWKLFRGAFSYENHGILIIKKNLTAFFLYQPEHWITNAYAFILEHPSYVNNVFKMGILLEGIFVIAFFTKKWDRLLLVALFFIFLGLFIYAGIKSLEFYMLAWAFVPLSFFSIFNKLRSI